MSYDAYTDDNKRLLYPDEIPFTDFTENKFTAFLRLWCLTQITQKNMFRRLQNVVTSYLSPQRRKRQPQKQQQQKLPEAVEQQQLHEQLNQEEQQLEQQEEQQPQERLQTTQPIIKKVS